MSLKTHLSQLERSLKQGRDDEPKPEDYRAGLKYYRETGRLPNPLEFPNIHEKVSKAVRLLAFSRSECDVTEPARRPMAPGMLRWHETLPSALRAETVIDLIGFPGVQPLQLQRNFVMAYQVAYGFKGEESDWQQFGLHGLGTKDSPWRAVHQH